MIDNVCWLLDLIHCPQISLYFLLKLHANPLIVASPLTVRWKSAQKLIDIEDEKKLRSFMDKRISQEVEAGCLGNEWKVSKTTFSL